MRSHVTSTILYACESWTLTAELQRRIQAMEMLCHRKILRISYTKTFFPTRKSCQAPAGNRTTRRSPDHCKETQTAVVWSCTPFIRSGQNQLARHNERGKNRQRKREEDNIREWTSLELAKSQRAVKNRENWRKLVAKLSVVAQRPSRLRDRWDEMGNKIIFLAVFDRMDDF